MTELKELIIHNLTILSKEEAPFKRKYYIVAINYIKTITNEDIKNKLSFEDIPGIGKKINMKIMEMKQSGKNLDNVDKIMKDIEDTFDLTTVYGIGPSLKNKIESKYGKIKNIEHLIELDTAAGLETKSFLNGKHKIGLTYYSDFLLRIPRTEMYTHDKYINEIIKKNNFNLTYDISGSYRREKKDSGDIDILLTCKGGNLTEHYKAFVDCLKLEGYIAADLAYGNTKYMGVCKLVSGKHYRRIDIIVTKPEEYYFELLYFTGSDEFNKEMRRHALTLGYSLSQYNFTNTTSNETVVNSFESEEDIFNFLGLKYVEPKNRQSGALIMIEASK